ncbi:hypothetical protein K2173_008739 [Erythroxylum novogranatense]|uniref:Phytocyanin domain-containing protein n=1 Tax=Erythroxylum novogranatense TaxID=1862640 RepID=A0AAV8SLX2_9ROSI|nr:hypothetical protein K2173_008739 [Erythroxylum novogranatense]
MAKLVLTCILLALSLALTCNATNYMVGDTAGWDLSTDLDSWVQDKKFKVGDVLSFQYSSYHSVDEMTKDGYESCNMSKVLRAFPSGNTSVPLTSPGTRYFVCGNKLHCLGGMKMQVNVEGNQPANSPVAAPQAQPQPGGTGTQPSFKNNNPTLNSAGFSLDGRRDSLGMAFTALMAFWLWMFQI